MLRLLLALVCFGYFCSQALALKRPTYGQIESHPLYGQIESHPLYGQIESHPLYGQIEGHALYGQTDDQVVRPNAFHLDVGKMILDVDAGADDASAMLLTLGHDVGYSVHGVQVVAVTCVHGNTDIDNVVRNVLVTLHVAQRMDIPVYRGAREAIHVTPPTDNFFGKNGFGDFVYRSAPDPDKIVQKKHAANALIDIVTESPGEVTVLCLGPLTNIALAIRLDPLFLNKVRRLVVLGGSVEGVGNVQPGLEFNFYKDPEAAFIVFNATDTRQASIKPIVLLPWDTVFKRASPSLEWRKNILGTVDSPRVRLMNLAERVAMRSWKAWNSADTLLAGITVNSSLVQAWNRYYAFVETEGRAAGAVFVDYIHSLRMAPNVIIVEKVDLAGYKDLLLKKFAE